MHEYVGSLVDRFALIIIAISLAALALSLWTFVTGQAVWPDHSVYRRSVQAWLDGRDFLPSGGPITNTTELPWVYPPFAILFLLPFAALPLKLDITLLFVLNTIALSTTLYLVVRHTWRSIGRLGAYAVALAGTRLAIFLEPVAGCFFQGQINILLMGLIALDCLTTHPRRPRGMLIGLAAAVKIMPAAFLLVFLVRKEFRPVLVAAATGAVATAIGFLVDFEASVKYWFLQGPAASAAGSPLRSNQSIMAVLARLELPDAVRYSLWIALCVVLTVVACFALRRSAWPAAVTVNAVLALLVSPTSWSNHWVWMAPALLLMFGYALRARSLLQTGLATATTVLVVTAPFVVLSRSRAEMLSLSPIEHLRGASYVLAGAALIVLAAVHARYQAIARAQRVSGEPVREHCSEPVGAGR